ncbi:hypothetical protein AU210_014691 [Fusarium oxysporum f. sp. radicis-cucumerinum]|uniref:Uncharacterized protein n=1 Tax=Fusarium oxysporum f. sp. radicis-cucumerinum TaxID=327505 RepID=A0A2H3G5B7_FUSOX|nr:hypothetical protein AU210_014691 [Fusarium oxysporum f. sp. radicis-cucumerinum]
MHEYGMGVILHNNVTTALPTTVRIVNSPAIVINYGTKDGIGYDTKDSIDYSTKDDINYGTKSDIDYGTKNDIDYGIKDGIGYGTKDGINCGTKGGVMMHLDFAFRTEEHKHPAVDNGIYNTKSTVLSINLDTRNLRDDRFPLPNNDHKRKIQRLRCPILVTMLSMESKNTLKGNTYSRLGSRPW